MIHRFPASVALCLVAAGCAAVPPGAARIQAHTANAPFCGHSGSPICEARVSRVDGKAVTASDAVFVEPGTRRLGVHCRINLSIMIGDAQSFEREITVDLAEGGRYRLDAAMAPEPCSVTLVREAR
jgi:hypothetical protein